MIAMAVSGGERRAHVLLLSLQSTMQPCSTAQAKLILVWLDACCMLLSIFTLLPPVSS